MITKKRLTKLHQQHTKVNQKSCYSKIQYDTRIPLNLPSLAMLLFLFCISYFGPMRASFKETTAANQVKTLLTKQENKFAHTHCSS